jgi:hypothetical protein
MWDYLEAGLDSTSARPMALVIGLTGSHGTGRRTPRVALIPRTRMAVSMELRSLASTPQNPVIFTRSSRVRDGDSLFLTVGAKSEGRRTVTLQRRSVAERETTRFQGSWARATPERIDHGCVWREPQRAVLTGTRLSLDCPRLRRLLAVGRRKPVAVVTFSHAAIR